MFSANQFIEIRIGSAGSIECGVCSSRCLGGGGRLQPVRLRVQSVPRTFAAVPRAVVEAAGAVCRVHTRLAVLCGAVCGLHTTAACAGLALATRLTAAADLGSPRCVRVDLGCWALRTLQEVPKPPLASRCSGWQSARQRLRCGLRTATGLRSADGLQIAFQLGQASH